MKWLLPFALAVASCSLVTDFEPGRAGAGGAAGSGGQGGTGGSGGGMGGSGGRDAAADRPLIDGPGLPDAAVDARVNCMVNSQCDDGIYCTVDYCDVFGICRHSVNDQRCATPDQCVIDSCNPENPMHDPNGCIHTPLDCGTGRVCDPQLGCVFGNCVIDGDCRPPDCCTMARCSQHLCRTQSACPSAQTCCMALNGTCLGCRDVCALSP